MPGVFANMAVLSIKGLNGTLQRMIQIIGIMLVIMINNLLFVIVIWRPDATAPAFTTHCGKIQCIRMPRTNPRHYT